jgi:hypothetical protein
MFIVVPFGFILMAVALTKSLTYFKKSIPFQLVCTCITTFLVLNYFQIADVRNPNSYERERRVHNTNIYKNLEKTLPRGISVVMNVPAEESADCMFYNKGISAYHYCLQKHELEIIKKQKIPIAVFEEHPGYAIPQYIKNYSLTYIIKMPLK